MANDFYDKNGNKAKYIENIESNSMRTIARKLFSMIAPYETKKDKDILEMEVSDIGECLKYVVYTRKYDLSHYKSIMRDYFSENNNTGIFAFDKLWEKITTYSRYELLLKSDIDKIANKFDTTGNGWYYNAIMYSVFYGFNITKLTDFINLKESDIDFDNSIIRLQNYRTIDMKDKPELRRYLKSVISRGCEYSSSGGTVGYDGKFANSVFKVAVTARGYDNIEDSYGLAISRGFTNKTKATIDRGIRLKEIHLSGLMYYIYNNITREGGTMSDFLENCNEQGGNFLLQKWCFEFSASFQLSEIKARMQDYLHLLETR